MLHFFTVFFTGGGDIYSRSVYTAVSEDIRELCYILFNSVKGSCKEMPQVMRKDLFGWNSSPFAKRFHLAPYIGAIQRLARLSNKYCARGDAVLLGIAKKLFLQGGYYKYGARFALEGHCGLSSPYRLCCDI